MASESYTIFPLGDSALTIYYGNVIDENLNYRVQLLFQEIQNRNFKEILDVIPAYSSLTILYNILEVDEANGGNKTAFEIMSEKVKQVIKLSADTRNHVQKRVVKVPVCYAMKYALDIQEIANIKNLSVAEVIQLHVQKKYRVYMLGFLPGFPYMGEVDERIVMPRKNQPRVKITAGSVGVAAAQTGIYPFDSPGGWNIIGRTPLQIFNKEETNITLFEPGDEVEFYSISEDEFENYPVRNT